MPEKGAITASEAGKRGGKATSERHGHEFYVVIGKKGGKTTRERYGLGFYEEIGARGGKAMSKKHGHAKGKDAMENK